MALFRYDEGATVTPVNEVASLLIRERDVDGTASPERFELERTAQALGQQYFDVATKAFFAVARQAMAHAEIHGSSAPVFEAAKVELLRVEVIVRQVGSGRQDLATFMALVEQINEARVRLLRDLTQ